MVERLGRELHAIEHGLKYQESAIPTSVTRANLRSTHPFAPRTVDRCELAADVVVSHQPLELVVHAFAGIVRAKACRLPVSIHGRQESAETEGDG